MLDEELLLLELPLEDEFEPLEEFPEEPLDEEALLLELLPPVPPLPALPPLAPPLAELPPVPVEPPLLPPFVPEPPELLAPPELLPLPLLLLEPDEPDLLVVLTDIIPLESNFS